MRQPTRLRHMRALYPIAAGALPPLLMMLANIAETEWSSVWLPLLLSMVLASTIYAGLYALLRQADQAALVTTCWLVLIFSCGHVVHVMATNGAEELSLYRTGRTVCIAAAICIAAWVWYVRPKAAIFTRYASSLTAILLTTTIAQLGWAEMTRLSPMHVHPLSVSISSSQARPDIYYIILDGYARNDILHDVYDFDNTPFTTELTRRGFYVADKAYANYPMTFLSLASSLNMTYLDQVASDRTETSHHRMHELIYKHTVGAFLQKHGYTTVHFCTRYTPTLRSDVANVLITPGFLCEFHSTFLRTTVFWPLLGLHKGLDVVASTAQAHLHSFEHLPDIADDTRPTFTLCHIVAPHPPYVFDRHGNLKQCKKDDDWRDRAAYIEQLQFVNHKMLDVVDQILKRSTEPPIIIVQADHGPASCVTVTKDHRVGPTTELATRERFAILNAHLGPPEYLERLYPSMSPVNTFRVLFAALFGTQEPPLEDRHYLSWYSLPYDFLEVTRKLHDGGAGAPDGQ